MTSQLDALNNLTSADEEDIKEKITRYFEEMELDDAEIEKRIGLAVDLEKGFRNLFILMLTAQIVGEPLVDRRDDFVNFAYHDYADAMIENGYSNDTYYSGIGYIEQYAKNRCGEIVDTAILHKADDYYFSSDHSIAIGEDEGNAVGNYYREQMAIAQGYTMKTWVTFHDSKVRHSHRLLDGRTIDIFKPFEANGGLMMFPLDVSLGVNKREIYNCRCVCEYSGKTENIETSPLENSTISGIMAIETSEIIDDAQANYARSKSEFCISTEYYNKDYDVEDLLNGIDKSKVGKESLDYMKSKKTLITLNSLTNGEKGERGASLGNSMTIYFRKIKDQMDAEKTIVHEATHMRFNIGLSQHAEAVCYAHEKMHELNRDYLTAEEWQGCVKDAIETYPEYQWEEGGYGDYGQFNFVKE